MEQEIYFRQLLAGRELATMNPAAGQMRNFMYLIGDPSKREAVIVDPAWDVKSLLKLAREDEYEVVGALVTHYHPDHVGGSLFGLKVEGLKEMLEEISVPIYVNKHEADGLKKVTSVSDGDLRKVDVRRLPCENERLTSLTAREDLWLAGVAVERPRQRQRIAVIVGDH